MPADGARAVVYSAVFGPLDFWPTYHEDARPTCDMVLFTDDPKLAKYAVRKKMPWRVKVVERSIENNAKAAKEYKLLPHRFLAGYDTSLWVDANICMLQDPGRLMARELAGRPWAQHRHPNHVKDAYHEARRCELKHKDSAGVLRAQSARYRAAGLPEGGGVGACYALMRRHNDPRVVEFGELWWRELLAGSSRDQVAWPYVRWRLGFDIGWIETRQKEWMKQGAHRRRALK